MLHAMINQPHALTVTPLVVLKRLCKSVISSLPSLQLKAVPFHTVAPDPPTTHSRVKGQLEQLDSPVIKIYTLTSYINYI